MMLEGVVKLVEWWVRLYTRGLPRPIAQRRVDEIAADLQDHIAHDRARHTSDRRIAISILSRMARGLTADTSWRVRHLIGDSMKPLPAIRHPLALGLVVALATTLGVMFLIGGGAPIAGIIAGLVAALAYAARRRKASRQT